MSTFFCVQTVDRPKDWYKTMFKQIHKVHKAGKAELLLNLKPPLVFLYPVINWVRVNWSRMHAICRPGCVFVSVRVSSC